MMMARVVDSHRKHKGTDRIYTESNKEHTRTTSLSGKKQKGNAHTKRTGNA